MCYIVLDMEWNQPLSYRQMIKDPFNFTGEIIQIGAVKLNKELEQLDTFDVIVKPRFYPYMNPRVEEVTQITDADLAKGVPLEKAIEDFKAWCGDEAVLLTWGEEDLNMLEDNLDFYRLDSDWIPESFDAQWMFDDQVTMEGRQYSLDYARYTFGIKGLDAHNALNDALNTAEVLRHLEVGEWIEEERAYREEAAEDDDY